MRLSSFIVHLSSFALLLSICVANARAQQWIVDGGKALPVADPAGLRSQIGAVASVYGQATNLTVVDTLTVAGVVESTTATISGADAGDYAGIYDYAGTDAFYGDYFTNSAGRFLSNDADYEASGYWLLGDAIGGFVFGNDGQDWYNDSWSPVDILMTGTPSYGSIRGNVMSEGNVSAKGDVTAEGGVIVGDIESIPAAERSSNRFSVYDPSGAIDLSGNTAPIIANNFGFRIASGSLAFNELGQGKRFYNNFGSISAEAGADISLGMIIDSAVNMFGYSGTPTVENFLRGYLNLDGNVYLGGVHRGGFENFARFGGVIHVGQSADTVYGNIWSSLTWEGSSVNTYGDLLGNLVNASSFKGAGALVITNGLRSSILAVNGGTYSGTGLIGAGVNNTQTNDFTLVVGSNITTFVSNSGYAGSFVATSGNGQCTTNNRYYFGSNSWLFVSGTNLMFRNSAGNIGTVNITY